MVRRPSRHLRGSGVYGVMVGVALGVAMVALLPALTSGRSSRRVAPVGHAVGAYGRLPLRFEANRGQTDSRVKFIARGANYTLFLTPRESVLSLTRPRPQARTAGRLPSPDRPAVPVPTTSAVVRMRLVGGNPRARLTGLTRLPGHTNYLIGSNPKAWRTGVPGYASALSRGVYPGIDLLYHGGQGHLEYDFQVAPGADPHQITLRFSGARTLSLDHAGNLLLNTAAGALQEDKPLIYQQYRTHRHTVPGRFTIEPGHRVAFHLGPYDHGKPLVIDPALVYSTYLGGGTGGNDLGNVVAADASGAAYVAGSTTAIDFPITNGVYQAHRGNYLCRTPSCTFISNAFVTKIGPDGALLYSTYVGGTTGDSALGIAVSSSGRAYITGTTRSSDFPTTPGAFSRQLSDGQSAFLSVLDATGSALVYSTYLAGTTGTSVANGVAVDPSGHAYIVGTTTDTDFPTTAGASQVSPGDTSGLGDAFVAKFDPAVSGPGSRVYATYVGGSASDAGNGIAVDSAGNAYAVGLTSSTDLFRPPAPPGFQRRHAGNPAVDNNDDGFVVKLNPAGSGLDYGTYLGGTGNDIASGIALDGAGNAYVTGFTQSTRFPLMKAFQPQHAGSRLNNDAFVTKLAPDGKSLVYSSYLGGLGDDIGTGIGVAPAGTPNAGTAYVAGTADTIFGGGGTPPPGSFPTVDPLAPSAVGGDAFVSAVKPDGSGLSFSTYLGGGGEEDVGGIYPGVGGLAVDAGGNVYVAGATTSTDFPTHNAFQTQNFGGGIGDLRETFVAKIAPASPAAPLVTGLGHRSGPTGTSVVITGHGFTNASTVQFGATGASAFTVNSDTQITATAPPGVPGPVGVTVTTTLGTSPWNPIATFIYAQGTWDLTGALNVPRLNGESATWLANGEVLVAGGLDSSSTPTAAAELYDPARGTWTPTGSLNAARSGHTATLLSSGDVLVAGGFGSGGTLASAELYNPGTGAWTATGSLSLARVNSTATPLLDGKVLVVGGVDGTGKPTSSAEIYDPVSGTWSGAGTLADARSDHTATLLSNGQVLVVGGTGSSGAPLASAELYDPSTNSWATTGPLSLGRANQSATRLSDGSVLVAGGARGVTTLSSAEVYDPTSGEFGPTAAMAEPRASAAAALLADGTVLVAGGNIVGNPLNTAEVYDPTTGQWESAGVMNRYRNMGFAVGLNTGAVLVGGDSQSGGVATDLYTSTAPGSPPPGPGPNPGPNPGPGLGPGPSGAPPVVTHYGLTNSRFVVAHASTSLTGVAAKANKHKHRAKHRRGTTFKYTLSEAATAKIVISRRLAGRRRGMGCAAPSRKLRHARRCVRLEVRGTLTRTSHQGVNKLAFSGRIGSRALTPGNYQATLTATNAGKRSSKPQNVLFTIVRR